MPENIFVVGLDDFNLRQLQSLKHSDEYRIHALGTFADIKAGNYFPVRDLLRNSIRFLSDFPGSVDAVVGYWDFPVSTLLPLIRKPFELSGPSLEAVLKCEHKYWSRQIQGQLLPDLIPDYAVINPFDVAAAETIHLEFPFWLKPVKAASSFLGFRIHDRQELESSLEIIRKGISRFAEPFNYIMQMAELPQEIAAVDGYHCIAEEIISQGSQCTLEGYMHNGKAQVYGVIDSIREGRHQSCFARYQYPSVLPRSVQQRMIDATGLLLGAMAYDNSPFNIEFFWNREDDSIRLLEINTRISKSHCPLFKLVDGEYNHAVMIDVALGRQPDFPAGKGRYPFAAKFMLRHYQDGLVNRVPGAEEIAAIKQRFPDTEIQLHIQTGMRLSALRDQDSYSYEIAVVFMGAESESQLLANYEELLTMLPFDIKPVRDRCAP